MKKWTGILIAVVLLWPPGSMAGEIERIQQKGVITVSLNRDYPPFAMERGDVLTGLDVDLAYLLADLLGVEVRFISPETYDRQIPGLLAGKSDIIMAAMTRTPQRGLKVSFSDPYFEVSQAALVNRPRISPAADAYFDLLEVKDLKLGVKTGTTHEAFAQQLFPAQAIVGFPTAAAAADALVQGKVDAMVADSPFVQVWRNTHVEHYSRITALLTPVTREYYAFAIRQGDPDFLNWLNLFVDQIRTDGTLDLLKYEYFEVMAWAKESEQREERLNLAQFLKNRFLAEKRATIEQQREAFRDKGAKYE